MGDLGEDKKKRSEMQYGCGWKNLTTDLPMVVRFGMLEEKLGWEI